MPRYMDRAALKADARDSMRQSAVSPYLTALIYCAVVYVITILSTKLMRADAVTLAKMFYSSDPDIVIRAYLSHGPGAFAYVIDLLLNFMLQLLYAGFVIFVLNMIRRQANSFWNLMDGFQHFLKIIGLNIVSGIFVFLWSLLFVIPGIVASYRYRQAPLPAAGPPRDGDHGVHPREQEAHARTQGGALRAGPQLHRLGSAFDHPLCLGLHPALYRIYLRPVL